MTKEFNLEKYLAGGEPMIRRDVIEMAGERPDILFPIFTNGTMINDSYIELLNKKSNLPPVRSVLHRWFVLYWNKIILDIG